MCLPLMDFACFVEIFFPLSSSISRVERSNNESDVGVHVHEVLPVVVAEPLRDLDKVSLHILRELGE